MWTSTALESLIKEKMGDYLFVVVSNRQPYVHSLNKSKIECQRGVGGVISALDPVMQACQGLWVALSSGNADRLVNDAQGRLRVPEQSPRYTLKRVFLSKQEELGYYYGYSNSVLWPLSHLAFQRPIFKSEDWRTYQDVNRKFAQAVIDEVGDKKAFIWIQDYHLCLLPKYLKEMAPKQFIIAHFWHIPWPSYEVFRICPQKNDLLEGLLCNDLLGFHIRYHSNNFLDVVDRELECKIDRENQSIIRNNHETLIRNYPIGVDYDGINEKVETADVKRVQETLCQDYKLHDVQVLIGLDRIDYTKGLPEKLKAIDLLLERHPELKEKIIFLQIGVISRLHIQEYKNLNDEINALVEDINWRHSTASWSPIIFLRRNFSLDEVLALYRISDVGLVGSLHDGMNLVAKEFIASRSDEQGVLVLSQFAGAARELNEAILVNPYDREEFSEGIYKALTMTEEEQKRRMTKMREIVRNSNIFRWAGKMISDLLKLEFKE
jgi:trehalose 6-phosphate synthase